MSFLTRSLLNVDSMLSKLPEGRLALCVVGGGFDGDELAEAFLHAELPDDMIGVVVTGPYMPEESRMRLNRAVRDACRRALASLRSKEGR